MANGQVLDPETDQEVDPVVAAFQRERAERDAAQSGGDDPLVASFAAERAARDASREAAPAEKPDERNLFQRVRDFVFPQEEGRVGPPDAAPAVEAPEPEERVGTRLERQAANLPPIEVRRGALPLGEIGGPDVGTEELIRDPFSDEMVRPPTRPLALSEPGVFEEQLGLQPPRIPHVEPAPTLLERIGIGEREPTMDMIMAQPDVSVGPDAEPTGGRFARPFGSAPPSMRASTNMERISAAINRAGREQQERFEEIPLVGRLAISGSRAALDVVSLGRFDSEVSDLIDKANQVVAQALGVAPPELTVEQLFSSLDRSLPEKLVGGAVFLGGAGVGIRLTGMGVSATARLASRGSRTRTFLQSFNPNVAVSRSTRMLQSAVEGIPFDLAFEAATPEERAANLVIGLVGGALLGATPIAGKVRAAGEVDPRFRDPTTAQGATRTGPEAFPVRRTRPEPPPGERTLAETLEGESARLDAEESAEASAVVPDGVPTTSGRRPRVLTPENQAMHDAALEAPDLPALRQIIDNDPEVIEARLRPQPGHPEDTANLHSDGATSQPGGPVWDPRRVRTVHDPAVKTLEEGGGWADQAARRRAGAFFEGPVRRDKIIYMVTGPPAAGKSTLSNQLLVQIRGMLIDTDEVKKFIPEFEGGRASGTVHRESSIIAHDRMFKAAVRRGDNIVFPMVGKSREHVIEAAADLKTAGYQVHIVLNELPPLEAVRRSYTRFKRTDKYIPEAYILDEVGNAPTSMYREAVESGLFTSHQRFTNDVPRGQSPRLLESGGDLPDGRTLFTDEAATARKSGSDPGAGRLRRGGDDVFPQSSARAGRGAGAAEVEVRSTPPPDGPARAPEVTPRQVTDPIPPKEPVGVQANGRGGFFNFGAVTEGVVRTKAFLKREFTAAGDLPQRAWRLLLKSEGWFGAQMTDMKFTLRRFDDSLREAYGTTNLNTSQKRRLNAAMSGQIPLSRIPETLRPIVRQMRERVDGYSQQMMQSGMVEGPLAAVIADNLGTYLSRSYKVFDNPEWILANIPERVVNRARSWLRAERKDLNESEIQGLMESILNKQVESPLQFLTGGTLGSKNLSMLIKRKDIHPSIRALMGEHTDVRVRYARSVSKMSRALTNHGFLTEIKRSLGAGPDNPNGLFFKVETSNANGSFIEPIAAAGSKVMEPLNGLFTTPEIAAAFKRQYDAPGAQHWLYNAYLKANALVKFDKTVLSLMTHVRNLIGNAGFATANGHWNVGHFGRAIAAVNASAGISRGARLGTRFVAGKVGIDVNVRGRGLTGDALAQQERRLRIRDQRLEDESPWEAYYKKLQALGVVDSSAHAGELQAVVRDAANQGLDNVAPDPGLLAKAVRGTIKGATAIYRAEDDLWKVVAFENEFARYRKAMPDVPVAEVEETAAWIVRNTYPNYGMISSGVQQLRKNILVGSFVSFPAEVFRTLYHTMSIAAKEVRSPNAEIRKIGATRLVGLSLASGGVYAASAASRWKNGIDRDQDAALRPFLAPWQRNSSLIYTNREKNGVYSLIDLSYTDPYSYVRDPLRALFSGEDWQTKLRESVVQLAAPFLGEEILISKVSDWRRNQKQNGGKVFNEEDHPVDQTYDILAHFWDAIEPGTVTSAKRIAQGIRGETNVFGQEFDTRTELLAVMTGHRLQKTDVRQSLRFRTGEMNTRLQDANAILNRIANREGNVTDEELTEAFQRSERSRAKVFEAAHDIALKAINFHGLTALEVRQQYRDGGMSRANAAAVVDTGIPPRRTPRIDDVNRAALIRRLNRGR
jgi:predicted kinase